MNKYLLNNQFFLSSHGYWGMILILLLTSSVLHATTINISVNGSNQPVTTSIGQTVQFDVSVICSGLLEYVPGTAQSKDNDTDAEVAWSMQNNSPDTIRLTGFGVSWNCITDTANLCATWSFDYLLFDSPVTNPINIYDDLPASSPTFPVTDFDTNVGGAPFDQPYLDVTSGSTVLINEIEFVDSSGDQVNNVPSGTQVEFTVTWRDINGNTYPQIFTVTWP